MITAISSDIEARAYQIDTVDHLVDRIESGDTTPVCVASPTGSGKSVVFRHLVARVAPRRVCIYVDRKELLNQTARHLDAEGIKYGIRASGYDPALLRNVQLCMIQTVKARSDQWKLHPSDVVIADEAHCMCTGSNLAILKKHQKKHGALVIGFTATPIDIETMFEDLHISTTYKHCFDNGYLTPAVYYDVDQPDRRFIKTVKTPCIVSLKEDMKVEIDGQWVSQGKRTVGTKLVYKHTQQVVGHVIEHYKLLNPFSLPTLVFAPDCDSSFWMCQQFEKAGIRAAHIDGEECYVDGERFPGTRKREEIIERFKCGDVHVIVNRFVLTTGIDIPEMFHIILAVPFGSLKVFRQACGRLFRNHPAYRTKIIQDHGANAYLHGDPMEDIDWQLGRSQSDMMAERLFKLKYNAEETEPLRCGICGALRRFILGGDNQTCPNCGMLAGRGKRKILQTDGRLVETDRQFIPPPRYVATDKLKKRWENTFWRMMKSRHRHSLSQAVGLFMRENGGREPRPDWKYMPRTEKPGERHAVFRSPLRDEIFSHLNRR